MRSDSLTAKRNAVIYSTGNLVSGMYARGRDGGLLVRMGLLKIYDICWLSSLEYALTWVARPERDGYGNFTILPADTSLVKSPTGKSKMQEFIDDTRRLFNRHNRGDVKEFFLK